jgi:hypothetical protein
MSPKSVLVIAGVWGDAFSRTQRGRRRHTRSLPLSEYSVPGGLR